MTMTNFDGLGLVEPFRLALKAENYLKPTPIQVRTIPLLAEGKDLLGIAETGTGKTAAFALPILQRLSLQRLPRTPGAPHALILAPTRELAGQIAERFGAYGRRLPLRTAVIFGGVNQHHQVKALKAGVDILIATPGRLLDLCNQRHVRLDKVSILVLDEADRMLDMGFIRDVRKIVSLCRRDRQTLLFSATMPAPIAKLAHDILERPGPCRRRPAKVAVDRITQRVFFVGAKEKRALLEDLLTDRNMDRVLVFTRTKRGADRVCRNLVQAGFAAVALHGNKAQNARVRALEAFRRARRAFSSPPTSPRAASTFPASRMSSTMSCPTSPRATCTASAAPPGPARKARPCHSAIKASVHHLQAIERLMRSTVNVGEHRLAVTPPRRPQRIATAAQRGRRSAKPRRNRSRGRRFAGVQRSAPSSAKGERAYPIRGDLR